MDWRGLALFGLLATNCDRSHDRLPDGRMAGLDLPLVLATFVTPAPDKDRFAEFFIRPAAGQRLALGYSAVLALLRRAIW